jgi:adenylate cyclase
MGVHTGEVIVGNFGGSTLFDYRALGDPVNTAARLESANRYLGTTICISEAVVQGCHGISARPIGQLMLIGKSVPVMVFEPLGAGEPPDALYQMAYGQMKRGAPEALVAFKTLALNRPGDRLVAMHLARLLSGDSGDRIVLQGK